MTSGADALRVASVTQATMRKISLRSRERDLTSTPWPTARHHESNVTYSFTLARAPATAPADPTCPTTKSRARPAPCGHGSTCVARSATGLTRRPAPWLRRDDASGAERRHKAEVPSPCRFDSPDHPNLLPAIDQWGMERSVRLDARFVLVGRHPDDDG